MIEKAKSVRDAFTLSLGGMTTIASFTAAPAIDQHRLNRAIDERLRRLQDDQPDTAQELATPWGRFWLRRRRRKAA